MLSPEDAEKVLTKNLANVIRKANSGKSLTASERALLQQQAAGGTLTGSGSAFAKDWHELAQRLNTTRKTLQNVRDRFPDHPQPRADGRHDVAAWAAFFVKHNIARAAEDLPAEEAAAMGAPKSVTDWKMEELRLKCDKLAIENAKTAGELVDKAEVEAGLSDLVQGFRQALNNMPGRLAQKIVGCSDYHEAEEIIQGEINVLLRTLQGADFLEVNNVTVATASPVITAPAEVEQELPDQRQPRNKTARRPPGRGKKAAGKRKPKANKAGGKTA